MSHLYSTSFNDNTTKSWNILDILPNNANTTSHHQTHNISLTYAILLGALIPLICIENIMILTCIWRTYKLHTINNMFVMNMAAADLLVGILAAPMTLLFALKLPVIYNRYACLTRFGVLYATCGASLLTLTCVSFNRYLTVLHPLSYPRRMKPQRVKQIIALVWFLMILVGFLPFMGFNHWTDGKPCDFYNVISTPYAIIAIFGFGLVCILMSAYYYGMIFLAAYRQRQRDQTMLNRSTSSSLGTGFLMTIFVLFWLPYLIMTPLHYFSNLNLSLLYTFNNFTIVLTISNSMINPIISFATDKTLRTVLFQMCTVRVPKESTSTSYHGTAISGYGNTFLDTEYEKQTTCIRMDDFSIITTIDSV